MTRQQHSVEPRPTGVIATALSLPAVSEEMPTKCHNVKTQSSNIGVPSKPVMDLFEPFIHDGSVSLSSDMSDCTPIKILRDTGASQSLLLSDILSFSEESSAGVSVLIKGVNCSEYTPVPLHTVYLSSNLVSGPVKVGVQSSLPFEGVQLILGNDLVGEKVVVNAIVTDKPLFRTVSRSSREGNSWFVSSMCCNSSHEQEERKHAGRGHISGHYHWWSFEE